MRYKARPLRDAVPPSLLRRPRVESLTLENGLTAHLLPIPGSPTVSVWVWYRVGSKNERPGITGASHWVEHMLFQGSPNYPKGAIDRAVISVGGVLNAFTDPDFTAYFITVPRAHAELPLDIEADRMTRATIAPVEVERERTVVRSEREGNENWPEFRVDEEVHALAYTLHPYRWETIGLKEDINALTADDLGEYYRRFYGPKNAVLVVAGEFDPVAMASEVRTRFGALPAVGDDPRVRVHELPMRGARRSVVRGPGTTPILEVGWTAPAFDDPKTPATILLDVLLGGETRLFAAGSGFGRGQEHPSSRLYRRLVDTGLAVHASSEWRPRVHPNLFAIDAQAARGVSLERLEKAILAEVDRLSIHGPSAGELREAREKIRRGAELAYEGATRAGFRLGYFSAIARPEVEPELLDRLLKVTAQGVRDRAREMFVPERSVTVGFVPEGGGADE